VARRLETIATAIESFERGTSDAVELADAKLSVITLVPELFSSAGLIQLATLRLTPRSRATRTDRFNLIATPVKRGWTYRIDYPYYSWAETL